MNLKKIKIIYIIPIFIILSFLNGHITLAENICCHVLDDRSGAFGNSKGSWCQILDRATCNNNKSFGSTLEILDSITTTEACNAVCGIKTPTLNTTMPNWKNPLDNLQVNIPGLVYSSLDKVKASCEKDAKGNPVKCNFPWIGEYIAGVYKYAIGIVGILAAVVLMIGGVMWIVAGGSATAIGEAKAWIGASLTGLVIALCSYLILYQVNPALVGFNGLNITLVQKIDEDALKEAKQRLTLSIAKYCGCVDWKNLYSTTSLNSAQKIADAIKSIQSTSPLINYSSKIYDLATQYNIDPAIFIGKSTVENALATVSAPIISKRNNIGSITCTCGSSGNSWVCDAAKNSNGYCFRNYNDYNASLEDYFALMSNSRYTNINSLRQMIAVYAPPSDNDTQGYINTVMTVVGKYHPEVESDKNNGSNCTCYSL